MAEGGSLTVDRTGVSGVHRLQSAAFTVSAATLHALNAYQRTSALVYV